MIFFKFLSLVSLTIIISQTNVYAGVYKCVKKGGAVYYNDKPCTAGLKGEKMKLGKRPSSKNVHQKPELFSPADQAMNLKQQEEAMLRRGESIDNGSHEMKAIEKKSLKLVEQQYAKREAELQKKEAIRIEKAQAQNSLAKIEQKKRFRQIQQNAAKQAQYNHDATMPGYNDQPNALTASKRQKIRRQRAQRKIDKEFRNTRYKGNDVHY